MVSCIEHRKTMLVGGGALHAPPALLRGAPPRFDDVFFELINFKIDLTLYILHC